MEVEFDENATRQISCEKAFHSGRIARSAGGHSILTSGPWRLYRWIDTHKSIRHYSQSVFEARAAVDPGVEAIHQTTP